LAGFIGSHEKMRFKSFLQEAQAPGSPKLVFEPIEDLQHFLETHCKDSMWMVHEDRPLYRGQNRTDIRAAYADLRFTKRISQDTSNWYTEIFDNHPEMTHFPKRSESLICSTNEAYARDFGMAYAVIPVDGAKIGMVNKSDIWAVKPNLFGVTKGIRFLNDDIKEIVNLALGQDFLRMADFDLLKIIDAELKSEDSWLLKKISGGELYELRAMARSPEFKNEFLNSILDAYSPTKLGLEAATTKTFRPIGNQEIWFDKGAVVISLDQWQDVRDVITWK
jgi:hypothetical protein